MDFEGVGGIGGDDVYGEDGAKGVCHVKALRRQPGVRLHSGCGKPIVAGAGEVDEGEAVWGLHGEPATEREWQGDSLRCLGDRFCGGVRVSVRGVVCDSGGSDLWAAVGEAVFEGESEERDAGEVLGGLGIDDVAVACCEGSVGGGRLRAARPDQDLSGRSFGSLPVQFAFSFPGGLVHLCSTTEEAAPTLRKPRRVGQLQLLWCRQNAKGGQPPTTPLSFAITSPPSGCEEDFHLQAVEHARHTKETAGSLDPAVWCHQLWS